MSEKKRLTREQIAERAARELPDGAYVNLGWGIPNLIADHLPAGITVYFHSENGIPVSYTHLDVYKRQSQK